MEIIFSEEKEKFLPIALRRKILFIDTETTGLPQTINFNTYYSYKDLTKYNSSRIIEICWSNGIIIRNEIIKPFDLNESEILNMINKIPKNIMKFDIQEIMNGKNLKNVLIEFQNSIEECDIIVCHNSNFDINIIKSEAFRLQNFELIKLIESKKIICTMMESKKFNNGKVMRLDNLYEKLLNEKRIYSHRAKQDVLDLIKCFYKMNL